MCEYIDNCSFYLKFSARKSFVWKAMIQSYCKAETDCVRLKTYDAEGPKEIPAEVLPTGSYASKAFLSLI